MNAEHIDVSLGYTRSLAVKKPFGVYSKQFLTDKTLRRDYGGFCFVSEMTSI
jgi:hypothetical protein